MLIAFVAVWCRKQAVGQTVGVFVLDYAITAVAVVGASCLWTRTGFVAIHTISPLCKQVIFANWGVPICLVLQAKLRRWGNHVLQFRRVWGLAS